MDLGELRGMPKVASGKVPPTRPTAREVGASPAREAPKASLKRSVVAPTEQAEDAARRNKKVKVLTRRHKSRLGEGKSHSQSKGKEPTEEPEAPAESEEGGASSAHQHPRSMKDLFKIKFERGLLQPQLARELYTLPSEVLMARATKEIVLSQHFEMTLFDRVHDASRLITFMDYRIKQLQEELDAMKSNGGPEAALL
ncbi:hypothetical protein B296_00036598 [Ensete ventricosum]|uniref:Uncharacterized protein n=1 Tax=Ensete ventricosum TaxID=4639 RepID=A0A426X5Z3_ENSVE|nr:hypothetical protein B296_00036598 [Ensete ventricosum]